MADHEATAERADVLRSRLMGLDPTNDFEGFLVEAGRALLEETRATACGLVRRFPGASVDLALLVLPSGSHTRRRVPLRREERHVRLTLPAEPGATPGFHNVLLQDMARGLAPKHVFHLHVSYRGIPVVDVELADPELPDVRTLAPVLEECAVVFRVAVLQERLRRERLETELLYAVNRELGRTLDLDDVLTTILDLLHQVVPFDAAAIYVLGQTGLSAVHQSVRGYAEDQKRALAIKLDEGLVGWAARTGEAVIVSDVTSDPRYLAARPETRSEMVVPLLSGGRVIGVFNLESDHASSYSPHDLDLLVTFGGQAAAALERARLLEEGREARRLEQELSIARRIQESFLPDPDAVVREGAVSGTTIPSLEVSGDYYDLMERGDGSLALAVADVSGKGMPAALIMSSLRAAFRLSAAHSTDPATLCAEMNTFLESWLRESEFVTGVFGFLDRENASFQYSNAGHNPPLLMHVDGTYAWLDTGGTILGAFRNVPYEAARVELRPGDRLVLYTDGLTESHRGDDVEFGNEAFVRLVRAEVSSSPREIRNAIVSAVEAHAGTPLPDDLTVLVIGTAFDE
ncbi:MAG TPA: GAF domain-containing SpoIIE family protein phosphatase [Candidatus Eisenbacteria bacterium]|nr:GAF domain-containing SpoIIE family protein phosphatase [Candidatus Eisenbacteria bacterium]